MRDDLDNLKTLGRTTKAPADYDPSVLDAFANRHPGRNQGKQGTSEQA